VTAEMGGLRREGRASLLSRTSGIYYVACAMVISNDSSGRFGLKWISLGRLRRRIVVPTRLTEGTGFAIFLPKWQVCPEISRPAKLTL
jgi:hypothetical protein